MTDYTQNVFFAPKDALITGDASKRIKGTEFDAELAEISVAIATKENTANKAVASGYAPLDSNTLVPVVNLPAATTSAKGVSELATSAEVITGTDAVRTVTPVALTAKFENAAGLLADLNVLTDPNADRLVFWDDSATAMVYMTVGSGLTISGTTITADAQGTNASLLTSGTIPDARIQASGVTQHQASLSIAGSQLTGSIADARLSANVVLLNGGGTFTAVVALPSGSLYNSLEIGWRSVPKSATVSGTITTAEIGKCLPVTGTTTIPASVFAAGDAVSFYNNSASSISLAQGASLTLRLAGTTSSGSRTLAARGLCTVWFVSATEAVVSGAGIS